MPAAVKLYSFLRVGDWWLVAAAMATFLMLATVQEHWGWFACGVVVIAAAVGWTRQQKKRFDRNWLVPWMRATILLLGMLSGVACIGTVWPVFGDGDRAKTKSFEEDQPGSAGDAAVDSTPPVAPSADRRLEHRAKTEREVAAIAKAESRSNQPPEVQDVLDELEIPDKPVDDWTDDDRGGLQDRIPPIIAKAEGGLPGLMEALCGTDAAAVMAPGCSVLAMIFSGAGISFGGGSTIHEQVAALRAMQSGNYDDLAVLLAAEPWPPSGATSELLDALVTQFDADRTKLGRALSTTSRVAICVHLSEATDQEKEQWRKFVVDQLDGSKELVDSLVNGSGCK